MKRKIIFKVIKSLVQIPKLIIEFFVAAIIMVLLFKYCSSNPDEIYFDVVNVPLNLEQAGFNESFVKSALVEGIENTIRSAEDKINNIQNGESKTNKDSGQSIQIVNEETVVVSGTNDLFAISIGKYLPKLLHKGLTVSCQIIELDDRLMAKIAVYDNKHKCWNIKTMETSIENKNAIKSNTKESLLSLLKQCGAFITRIYDPVASVLYDYNITENYKNPQCWDINDNPLYSRNEKIELLKKAITEKNGKEKLAYLVLGSYWQEQHDADSSIFYYNKYIESLSPEDTLKAITKGKIDDLEKNRDEEANSITKKLNKILEEKRIYGCKQLIFIKQDEKNKRLAKLNFYVCEKEKWESKIETYDVHLGLNGIKKEKHEGDSCTPIGLFSITEAFGRNDIETKITYKRLSENDIWVTDVRDSVKKYLYNTMGNLNNIQYKGLDHEPLYNKDVYDKVIVIDYNRKPKEWGKGSAIFIHRLRDKDKKNDKYGTMGCIAIDKNVLLQLFEQLDPSKKPYINISK